MTNLLPLESFRRILGYNSFHFWGLTNATVPLLSSCNDLVAKYNWQSNDSIGRDSLIEAIEQAEERLFEQLDWAVAPRYREVTLPYPQWMQRDLRRLAPVDASGRWLGMRLEEYKIQEMGPMATSTVQVNVAVTYSDTDGDGLDDTFTLTTASTTTETDADKIAVYFSSANRLYSEGIGDTWRILPVKVTINANGTVTILGRSWLLVKPEHYEGVGTDGSFPSLDPSTAANLVTTLDVVRRYTQTEGTGTDTSQGVLIWETQPQLGLAFCCGCDGDSPTIDGGETDPASYWAAIARVGIRNAERGFVTPGAALLDVATGFWENTSWGICRPPDRVTLRYLAGEGLVNGEMRRDLQRAVARLACAEAMGRLTACDTANREFYRWQLDAAMVEGHDKLQVSPGDLDNPFGTKAGQIYAWKVVKDIRVLGGVAI